MANKTTIPTKEQMQHTLEERHGKELQQAFSNAAVAICGLGGLGSNIAVSLARAGIGKLILIDFDRVDISNLHRQQYKPTQIGLYKTEALASNLKEIAPIWKSAVILRKSQKTIFKTYFPIQTSSVKRSTTRKPRRCW